MASSACCFSSPVASHGLLHLHRHPLRLLTTTIGYTSPSWPRPILRFASTPKLPYLISSSSEPPLDVAADTDEDDSATGDNEDRDERYGFEIELRKLPKRNRRLVRARVRVDAPLEAVWATLTDYEGLADFLPGLAECRLLDQEASFARLYQVGEHDLALGFKFNAEGTLDCYEGEMEVLPAGARRREIAFKMIEGDFKFFEGKWSVEEVDSSIKEGEEISADQEFQTTLSYVVELEPKLWVPVRLLEGRICKEIRTNLVSIREEAQRIRRLQGE